MIQKILLHGLLIGLVLVAGSSLFHLAAASSSPTAPQAHLDDGDVRAYGTVPAALISLTFDDSSPTVYDTAFPILEARGLPGTFYFITGALDADWQTRLKNLQNQGWEIGSHSCTHRDLTRLSEAELIAELTQSKADLEAAGLEVSGFAYPEGSGSKDNLVLRKVKEVYNYGRAVTLGYNQPIIHQYALRVQSQVSSTSLETMKDWVDQAVANREWLIILMHTVDNSGELYSITPQDLASLADHIRSRVDAGSLQAVTTREGLARQTQPAWQPIQNISDFDGQDLILTNSHLLWHFANDQVVDYLFDGYEWVESGKLQYWEWHGQYRHAGKLNAVALRQLTPDRSTVQFTLVDSLNADFSVVSTLSLGRGRLMAEVQIIAAQGDPEALMLGKYLSRRFSTLEGQLVTDGSLEHGLREYGASVLQFTAFDQRTDLLRVLSQASTKIHAEYADYLQGEFRLREIDPVHDLPLTWCVGGLPFDTLYLAAEAENGSLSGASTYYDGEDASPGLQPSGVILDTNGDTLAIQLTTPWPGNYILSIRQQGATPGDSFTWQIDQGLSQTAVATEDGFGYLSLTLPELTAGTHTLNLSHASGTVIVDYALLVPTSRSAATPAEILFPADLYCTLNTFLPLAFLGSRE